MSRRHRRITAEDGAAAVELAFVLPVLLLVLFGLVEFGRAYNAQIALTGAAREGARVMAVVNDPAAARTATAAAAPSLNPTLSAASIAITPASCQAGQTVTLTATHPVTFSTPLFGTTVTLTGKGVMRCGG